MTIALGYQLDKLELVHSTGASRPAVSFTDQNAQFLAFDVLTALSAIAAALLVGGGVHPGALAGARSWRRSGSSRRSRWAPSIPRLVQQFTVVPNQQAPGDDIHPQQHQHDPARLRPRRLGPTSRIRATQPLTPAAVAEDADTFQNARLWDYRPLRDTLDQLQTVRQYYNFTDVDTDRYLINGEHRQVMLSAPRARARERTRGRPAGSTSGSRLHPRHRRRDGPGQRRRPKRPAAPDHPRPAAGFDAVAPADHPAADLLRRAADVGYSIVDAQQASSTTRGGADRRRRRGRAWPTTRWTGTTGITLDTTLPRLLFALRFRDLNLLISDQVTADSQLLFHRSLADRLPRSRRSCATTRTRTSSSTATAGSIHPGRLHDERPVPERPVVRPATAAGGAVSATTRSTTSATASRSSRTPTTARLTFYDADPTDP